MRQYYGLNGYAPLTGLDASSGTATVYSVALKTGKGLATLLNAGGTAFQNNFVTVYQNGTDRPILTCPMVDQPDRGLAFQSDNRGTNACYDQWDLHTGFFRSIQWLLYWRA